MKSDGTAHGVTKESCQHPCANGFVMIVNTRLCQVLVFFKQMTDVMKKCGNDQAGRTIFGFRQGRTLQGMFHLRHAFAIAESAARGVEPFYIFNTVQTGHAVS